MLDDVLQALSDPTRREIVRLLREKDRSAGELSEHFSLAKSTLSGHFNVLKYAGLIVSERQGTRVVYSLNTSACEDVLVGVIGILSPKKKKAKGSLIKKMKMEGWQ